MNGFELLEGYISQYKSEVMVTRWYIYEKDNVCAYYNGGETASKLYLLCYKQIVLLE